MKNLWDSEGWQSPQAIVSIALAIVGFLTAAAMAIMPLAIPVTAGIKLRARLFD